MVEDTERRLREAQHRLTQLSGCDSQTWWAAFDELRAAERFLAAGRGEQ